MFSACTFPLGLMEGVVSGSREVSPGFPELLRWHVSGSFMAPSDVLRLGASLLAPGCLPFSSIILYYYY